MMTSVNETLKIRPCHDHQPLVQPRTSKTSSKSLKSKSILQQRIRCLKNPRSPKMRTSHLSRLRKSQRTRSRKVHHLKKIQMSRSKSKNWTNRPRSSKKLTLKLTSYRLKENRRKKAHRTRLALMMKSSRRRSRLTVRDDLDRVRNMTQASLNRTS